LGFRGLANPAGSARGLYGEWIFLLAERRFVKVWPAFTCFKEADFGLKSVLFILQGLCLQVDQF